MCSEQCEIVDPCACPSSMDVYWRVCTCTCVHWPCRVVQLSMLVRYHAACLHLYAAVIQGYLSQPRLHNFNIRLKTNLRTSLHKNEVLPGSTCCAINMVW